MKPPSEQARRILDRFKESESLGAERQGYLLDVVQERVARGDLPRFDVQAPWPTLPKQGWLSRVWSSTAGKIGIAATVAAPVVVGYVVRKESVRPDTVALERSAPCADHRGHRFSAVRHIHVGTDGHVAAARRIETAIEAGQAVGGAERCPRGAHDRRRGPLAQRGAGIAEVGRREPRAPAPERPRLALSVEPTRRRAFHCAHDGALRARAVPARAARGPALRRRAPELALRRSRAEDLPAARQALNEYAVNGTPRHPSGVGELGLQSSSLQRPDRKERRMKDNRRTRRRASKIALSSAFALVTALGWKGGLSASAAPIKVACIGEHTTHSHAFPALNRESQPAGMQEYPAMLQTMLGTGYQVRNFGDCCATVLQGYTAAGDASLRSRRARARRKGLATPRASRSCPTSSSSDRGAGTIGALPKRPPRSWNVAEVQTDYDDLVQRYQRLSDASDHLRVAPDSHPERRGDARRRRRDELGACRGFAGSPRSTTFRSSICTRRSSATELFKQPPDAEGEGEHVTAGPGLKAIADAVYAAIVAYLGRRRRSRDAGGGAPDARADWERASTRRAIAPKRMLRHREARPDRWSWHDVGRWIGWIDGGDGWVEPRAPRGGVSASGGSGGSSSTAGPSTAGSGTGTTTGSPAAPGADSGCACELGVGGGSSRGAFFFLTPLGLLAALRGLRRSRRHDRTV